MIKNFNLTTKTEILPQISKVICLCSGGKCFRFSTVDIKVLFFQGGGCPYFALPTVPALNSTFGNTVLI